MREEPLASALLALFYTGFCFVLLTMQVWVPWLRDSVICGI